MKLDGIYLTVNLTDGASHDFALKNVPSIQAAFEACSTLFHNWSSITLTVVRNTERPPQTKRAFPCIVCGAPDTCDCVVM